MLFFIANNFVYGKIRIVNLFFFLFFWNILPWVKRTKIINIKICPYFYVSKAVASVAVFFVCNNKQLWYNMDILIFSN